MSRISGDVTNVCKDHNKYPCGYLVLLFFELFVHREAPSRNILFYYNSFISRYFSMDKMFKVTVQHLFKGNNTNVAQLIIKNNGYLNLVSDQLCIQLHRKTKN